MTLLQRLLANIPSNFGGFENLTKTNYKLNENLIHKKYHFTKNMEKTLRCQ